MADRVLVVDDDLSLREFLKILLERDGHDVETAASGEAAIRAAEERWPALVLTDLNMPGLTGMDLLKELKAMAARSRRDVEVVMVTAYGTTQSAVEAMKNGAADYVLKPFNNDELRLVIQRALGRRALEIENSRLRSELQERFHFGRMVGTSPAMGQVYELIRRVKDNRINCLVVGESGSGKELVARAIHYSGVRAGRPFVALNCGAIPENLVESELFGYKKGAFSGAMQNKVGFIQAAHQGTLFLDEVNSLPLPAQVKLLRAIQERMITPVGDTREHEVDVRIIAASNADLECEIREGNFREDLYYRLNVVEIGLPPLRHRREDIPDLISHFLRKFAEENGKDVRSVSPEAMTVLRAWDYPGNVRELSNTMERAVALCRGSVIERADLPDRMLRSEAPAAPPVVSVGEPSNFPEEGVNLDAILEREERRWILAALAHTQGNRTRAAPLLQMTFRSLRHRIAKYGMEPEGA